MIEQPPAPKATPTIPDVGPTAVLQALLAGLIIGLTAIVFAISFTAIIYTGAMEAHLDRGIGLTLAGASLMALMGAARLSYRGTIVQPQDVTAVILSLAVAAIASSWEGAPDRLFATVAVLVAVATALTGAAAWIFGRLGLGFLARFIPYPVLGGFLAATGYLLLMGAVGMALGRSMDIWTLGSVFEEAQPGRWLPWVLAGLALAIASRRLRHGLLLPVAILLIVAAFYLGLWLRGIGIGEAREEGMLLGPFGASGFTEGIGPWILREAEWGLVLPQLPTVAAIAGMAIVGSLLYASALEIATGETIDSDRDLRGVGAANMVAALAGGMVGYHHLSPTLFARALGMPGPLCGVAVALVCAITLFFGAGVLSLLPVGVFASVIAFLGIDLLYTWLWVERRRLSTRDFAIVLVILAVAATVGFLQAIAIGIAASALLFIVAYSRVDVVRLRTSAAALRSRVERPEHELRCLAEHGGQAAVYVVGGYLFFGTATRLLDELLGRIAQASGQLRYLILDLRRVPGMDGSAGFALVKLHRACRAAGVDLLLSDVEPALGRDLARALAAEGEPPRAFERLQDAVGYVEEELLAACLPGGVVASGFLEELAHVHPGFEAQEHFKTMEVPAEWEVLAQGSPENGMIVLLSGRLRAEHVAPDGSTLPIATIREGTLVGEIGFYAGVPRSARVTAEIPSRLLVVEPELLGALAASHPALAADFHRLAASHLARRLMRTSMLLRDSER